MRRILLTLPLLLIPSLPAQSVPECDVTVPTESMASLLIAPHGFPPEPPAGPGLQDPDPVWIEETLAAMTLEQKVGQMLMPGLNPGSFSAGTVQSWIDNQHIGGIIYFGNGQSAGNIANVSNQIQGLSDLPLLIAIDAEAGLGARVADATIFPLLMGIGAADDQDLTEQMGRITARECRAVGVHIAFGPVVDVNTEPLNPIISTRSYSDDPDRVIRNARAFIQGARAEGVLTTVKHYPGHGGTEDDSHIARPEIPIPLEQIRDIHLRPYTELAATDDIDLVMTAHVWYNAVHPEGYWPATLSSFFNTDVLRGETAFDGVLISDAFTMAGLADAIPDETERVITAVEAGLDVILLPPNTATAHSALVGAVTGGRISQERIDESVRRVLALKSRAGIEESAVVDPMAWEDVLRHPEHLATVQAVCEAGFTRGIDAAGDDPLVTPSEEVLLVDLQASQTIFYRFSSFTLRNALASRLSNLTVMDASRPVSSGERSAILNAAALSDKVIVVGRDWWQINSASQVNLINDLIEGDTPVIYVGFGAPYHYFQIPNVDVFLCGYSTVPEMQEVAAEVLVGERSAQGELPVILLSEGLLVH